MMRRHGRRLLLVLLAVAIAGCGSPGGPPAGTPAAAAAVTGATRAPVPARSWGRSAIFVAVVDP